MSPYLTGLCSAWFQHRKTLGNERLTRQIYSKYRKHIILVSLTTAYMPAVRSLSQPIAVLWTYLVKYFLCLSEALVITPALILVR